MEILNENDNSPVFAEDTVLSLIISEVWLFNKPMYIKLGMHVSVLDSNVFPVCVFFQLTPVNSVVFTVQATDADNDKIIYSIDQTSVSSTLLLYSGRTF